MKYYAGIGSRETPIEICNMFEKIGEFLADKGYILRSGHAQGADQAFERGCDKVSGKKEIYIPWKGFENSNSSLYTQTQEAFELAEKYHPYWSRLSQGAQKLQARNCYQVLGRGLDLPFAIDETDAESEFIICWTKKGKGAGGTGQALRIAKDNCLPIFDAGLYGDIEEVKTKFNEFYKENK